MSEYWLEQDLARGLRPVTAPDELWSRIEQAPVFPASGKPSIGRAWWLAAAAAGLSRGRRDGPPDDAATEYLRRYAGARRPRTRMSGRATPASRFSLG